MLELPICISWPGVPALARRAAQGHQGRQCAAGGRGRGHYQAGRLWLRFPRDGRREHTVALPGPALLPRARGHPRLQAHHCARHVVPGLLPVRALHGRASLRCQLQQ